MAAPPRVELRVPGRGLNVVLPCYLPDALALALRRGATIYATPGALVHAKEQCARDDRPWDPDVGRWLEGLTPRDF